MQSPKDLIFNWNELVMLARCSCNQIINATLIGSQDIATLPVKPGSDLYTPSKSLLEAIDSSLWHIYYTKDDEVLCQLQKEFHAVELVEEVLSRE